VKRFTELTPDSGLRRPPPAFPERVSRPSNHRHHLCDSGSCTRPPICGFFLTVHEVNFMERPPPEYAPACTLGRTVRVRLKCDRRVGLNLAGGVHEPGVCGTR
jgi:hypothetical protein